MSHGHRFASKLLRGLNVAARRVFPRRVAINLEAPRAATVSIVSGALAAGSIPHRVHQDTEEWGIVVEIPQEIARGAINCLKKAARKNRSLFFSGGFFALIKSGISPGLASGAQTEMGVTVREVTGKYPARFFVPITLKFVSYSALDADDTSISHEEKPPIPAGSERRFASVEQKPPTRNYTDFPVDVVYTWVDGTDETWLAKKRAALDDIGAEKKVGATASGSHRFQNRDELKYSLRSIEMFAPFIRNVFIVTDAQTPAWLDANNPRVRIVDHSEIFSDTSVLPSFNSNAIENQIYKIPGLSENFIYMNDDFFLARQVSKDLFFANRNSVSFFPGRERLVFSDHPNDLPEYLAADHRGSQLLNEAFGIKPDQLMLHAPYACKKSVLGELEKRFGDAYRRCAQQKFRSRRDVRSIPFLFPHYARHLGVASPRKVSHLHVPLSAQNLPTLLEKLNGFQSYQFFCLNDARSRQSADDEEIDALIGEFLEMHLPIKSGFEL